MRSWSTIIILTLCSLEAFSQGFDLVSRQESIQGGLSETLKIPIQIRNNSERAQFYIIRKVQGDVGGTQKGYFCFGDNCLDSGIEVFSKKVEPGETLTILSYTLETGLMTGTNTFKFEVFARDRPAEVLEHSINVIIDEKKEKQLVFHSRDITIHDVYPNPVSDQAFIDYSIHNESVKAKVVIHNILGSAMGNYELPFMESKIKIHTEDLAAGVYFYTVYLDNDGVLTRKLIVRK